MTAGQIIFNQGEAKGRAEGRAESICAVLTVRGLSLSLEEKSKITACTDLKQLEKWLVAALRVESVQELWSPKTSKKSAKAKKSSVAANTKRTEKTARTSKN